MSEGSDTPVTPPQADIDAALARPDPKPVDWTLALSLYLKNIAPREICSLVGCNYAAFSKRKTRGKWIALKQKVSQLTTAQDKLDRDTKAMIACASESSSWDGPVWAEHLHRKMRSKVELIVDSLPNDAKSLQTLNMAAEVVRKLSSTDDGGAQGEEPTRIVDLGRLNEATIDPTPAELKAEAKEAAKG